MWAMTTRERKILKKVIPKEFMSKPIQVPNGGETSIEEISKHDRISSADVEAIYGCLSEEIKFDIFVDALRPRVKTNSDEELTEEQKKAKQEYRKRIAKLKERQANLEYEKMTEGIDARRNRPVMENFGKEIREVNKQMIAVINTLITVGGAFAFGFWGIGFAYPHLNLDIAERMLLGLVFGTIVFFADLYFIVKSMDVDEGKTKVQ